MNVLLQSLNVQMCILPLNFPKEYLLAWFWQQNWQFIKCFHIPSINFTLQQSSRQALKKLYIWDEQD